ncbi:MAG TPA: hypothetical protein VIU16_12300 [Gaiellaceae bacterium]
MSGVGSTEPPESEGGGFAGAGAGRRERIHVPLWRWAQWWTAEALALVLFYVLMTPVWFGLRALAWAAEFRARRRGQGLR